MILGISFPLSAFLGNEMLDFPLSFPFQAGPIEAFVSGDANTAEASRFDTGAQIDACLEAAHAADLEEFH